MQFTCKKTTPLSLGEQGQCEATKAAERGGMRLGGGQRIMQCRRATRTSHGLACHHCGSSNEQATGKGCVSNCHHWTSLTSQCYWSGSGSGRSLEVGVVSLLITNLLQHNIKDFFFLLSIFRGGGGGGGEAGTTNGGVANSIV